MARYRKSKSPPAKPDSPDSPDSAETSADKKLLIEAHQRFKLCVDDESIERGKRLEDLRFANLDQWDPVIRNLREYDPNGARPCLTIDKLTQYRMQIINEIRKNRPAVKVRPVDSQSDVKTAEMIQGLVRHDEEQSNASIAYEMAALWAIDTGLGYFRFITEYEEETSFDQKICVKPVFDAFSIYLGPNLMPDGSDAEYGFAIEDVPLERFKRLYPGKKFKASDFLDESGAAGSGVYWGGTEYVRVAEYFYKKYEDETLVFLSDGKTMPKSEYDSMPAPEPLMMPDGTSMVNQKPTIADTRKTQISSIQWCKLTGAEILEKRDWAGKWIPIVKVVGHERIIDGRKQTWGIVRPAIDSCRMYNYWASAITEKLALSPKTPFIGAVGQFVTQNEQWNKANTVNYAKLEYDAIDVNGNAVPPPQRVSPAPVEAAMTQQLQLIEHDIQTSIGMFKASVGEQQRDQSGRAIKALQSQSDTATFHFPDNLAKSIQHGGRIMVDLIPKIYDTKRVLRILGQDGKTRSAEIDPGQESAMRKIRDQQGKLRTIYNPGVGKYDVSVTVGPSYSTMRMETSEFLTEAVKGNPQLLPIIGDLMFRTLDAPMADQVADRLEKMLPPQLQETADGEEPIPPQAAAKMAQMQQMLKALQQGGAKLSQENQQLKSGQAVDMAKVNAEHQAKLETIKLDEKVQIEKARIAREKAEGDARLARDVADEKARCEQERMGHEKKMTEEKMTFERECRMKDDNQKEMEKKAKLDQSMGPQIQHTVEQAMTEIAQKIEDMKPVSVKTIKGKNGEITGGVATYANGETRSITIN